MPLFWRIGMNGRIFLIVCLILVIIGSAASDSITSSIVSDGAAFVSSSVISAGETYAARLFTSGNGSILRDLTIGPDNGILAGVSAGSRGPIGIDEYSGVISNQTGDNGSCIFILPVDRVTSSNKVVYTGLLKSGEYYSTRDIDKNLTALTMINGSGMILSRAESGDRNRTISHKSDVSGLLNLSEWIEFGGAT